MTEVNASVDVLSRTVTNFFFPQPTIIKAKDLLPGEDLHKMQAEATYRLLYDPRIGHLTKLGKKLCQEIKIPTESLHPKKLEHFELKYQESEVAHLHHKHHNNRRCKNLLRLTSHLQDKN